MQANGECWTWKTSGSKLVDSLLWMMVWFLMIFYVFRYVKSAIWPSGVSKYTQNVSNSVHNLVSALELVVFVLESCSVVCFLSTHKLLFRSKLINTRGTIMYILSASRVGAHFRYLTRRLTWTASFYVLNMKRPHNGSGHDRRWPEQIRVCWWHF